MAFDRNDPADLLALKTEVNTDPISMGYVPAGGTQAILDLLNIPANNQVPENGPAELKTQDLLTMLFAENISAGDQFRIQLLFEMTLGPDDSVSHFKTELSNLDVGLATAIAAHVRPLSRAEVLFSDLDEHGVNESVIISRADWIAARDS